MKEVKLTLLEAEYVSEVCKEMGHCLASEPRLKATAEKAGRVIKKLYEFSEEIKIRIKQANEN